MSSSTQIEKAGRPFNILVVDDHAGNRLALRAILDSPDYEFVEAESGAQALRRLLEADFGLLLIDVVMPDMSGFDLAGAIRERERTASIPIIFLSAQATDIEVIYRGYRAGAVDYLVKPLVPEMVRSKVAVFAELYRQRKQIEAQGALLVEAERRDTERRIEELRRGNERRYRNLADAVPHIIWTARPEGTVDYFNLRWFEYTGTSAGDAAGSWLGGVHPEDVAIARTAWENALRTGRLLETECRLLRRSDAAYRWQLLRAVPELGPSGDVVSWLGTFTDIHDQKRGEAALLEFKATLDAVLDAVMIVSAEDWRFVYVNLGTRLLLGRPDEELMQARPVDYIADYDDVRFREALAPLYDEPQRAVTLEGRCRRSDGRQIPVEFTFQLVRTADDMHVVAIARDVTERKAAELEREQLYEKALAAIRARDEFLSIASHELRTPLTSLKLQIEMLIRPPRRASRPPLSADQLREKIALAARSVEGLSRLIAQLMDVSRIAAKRLRIERERLDMSAVARDVVAALAADAAQANVPMTLRADEAVFGQWDPMRIEQVITNLVTNALKFGAGQPVDLAVWREGTRALLRVADHGIGIASGDTERMFERFERAESARKYGGLGLGLYIVRQIVQAHGGTVRVESAPGAGATFTVDLPLEPVESIESIVQGGEDETPHSGATPDDRGEHLAQQHPGG